VDDDVSEPEGLGHQGELHTFLIADVRGYTRFSDENGDFPRRTRSRRRSASVIGR
jgi:hypothetical protein